MPTMRTRKKTPEKHISKGMHEPSMSLKNQSGALPTKPHIGIVKGKRMFQIIHEGPFTFTRAIVKELIRLETTCFGAKEHEQDSKESIQIHKYGSKTNR